MNSGNLVLYSLTRASALSLNCHPSGYPPEYPRTFFLPASNFKLRPRLTRVSPLTTTIKLDIILLNGKGLRLTNVATVYDGKYGFLRSDSLTMSFAKSTDSLTLSVRI